MRTKGAVPPYSQKEFVIGIGLKDRCDEFTLSLSFANMPVNQALSPFGVMIMVDRAVPPDGDDGDSLRAAGQQIHPIAGRRCVFRALTRSPSLLRGTRRGRVRLAEIGKIRAHQPHIGRHPIAEGRVRDQRENHVHHVVAEAAAVEGGKAE